VDAGKPKYIINFSGTHPVVAHHTNTDVHTSHRHWRTHIAPTLTYTHRIDTDIHTSYRHWRTHIPALPYTHRTETDIHRSHRHWRTHIIPTLTYTHHTNTDVQKSYPHWHTHVILTLTYTLPSSTTARQILRFQNLKCVYWNTDWHCILIFCFKFLYLLMMHAWLAVTVTVELWYIVSTLTHILPSTTNNYGISYQHWYTYCHQQQIIMVYRINTYTHTAVNNK
jgi:hypothetical protein